MKYNECQWCGKEYRKPKNLERCEYCTRFETWDDMAYHHLTNRMKVKNKAVIMKEATSGKKFPQVEKGRPSEHASKIFQVNERYIREVKKLKDEGNRRLRERREEQ